MTFRVVGKDLLGLADTHIVEAREIPSPRTDSAPRMGSVPRPEVGVRDLAPESDAGRVVQTLLGSIHVQPGSGSPSRAVSAWVR